MGENNINEIPVKLILSGQTKGSDGIIIVNLTHEEIDALDLTDESRVATNPYSDLNVDYSLAEPEPPADIIDAIDVDNIQSGIQKIQDEIGITEITMENHGDLIIDDMIEFRTLYIIVLEDGTIIIGVDEDDDGEIDYYIVIDPDGTTHIFYDDPLGLFD
jgi:hypothetical protein